MTKKLNEIKRLIKKECFTLGFVDDWFYSTHLLGVEKFAKELLKKCPNANAEVVFLGVWLHDLQRIRGIKGDHAKMSAGEAEKVMSQFDYPKDVIIHVKQIILSHSCERVMPKTVEGKILASADAMSHYVADFYLTIAVTGQRDLAEFKKWALEKLDRDYQKKIFFAFARKMIEQRHRILKDVFTMK